MAATGPVPGLLARLARRPGLLDPQPLDGLRTSGARLRVGAPAGAPPRDGDQLRRRRPGGGDGLAELATGRPPEPVRCGRGDHFAGRVPVADRVGAGVGLRVGAHPPVDRRRRPRPLSPVSGPSMRRLRARLLLGFAAWSAGASIALGHGAERHGGTPRPDVDGPRDWHELGRAWALEPGVVIPLLLSAWLYGRGLARLWREAGVGHGVRRWEASCFSAGWLALALALVSPLHPWGSVLFSAHMTQHEVMMLVAAPLLVLGRPIVASLKALPPGWARAVVRRTRVAWWRRSWAIVTDPFVAWIVHAVVLWAWHIPALFQATIGNEFVHAIQHLSFLLSALLFWWAVMEGRRGATGYGVAVLYMFTTALHSGLLGALI